MVSEPSVFELSRFHSSIFSRIDQYLRSLQYHYSTGSNTDFVLTSSTVYNTGQTNIVKRTILDVRKTIPDNTGQF